MTSLELLKEIEAWLCFNTEPSKEETAKLRKSINEHVSEQLRLGVVIKSVCEQCKFEPECRFKAENVEQNCKFFIDKQTVL
jgi:hypothetical protein